MSTTRRADAPSRRPMTELMDRQPPFDLQAEIGVLGSIVLLPDVLDDVVMIVRPDDFYDDAHRKLFVHMTALHESGKKIDDTLLVNRLKTAGEFEAIGGAAYLSKIVNAVPNAAHATYYAEIVREKATFRSPEAQLAGELITRFAGPAHEALMRLLVWLSPVTVGRGQPAAITLHEAG